MTWRQRTDLWYGRLLLRPVPQSENAEFGGAYVAFAVVADSLNEAFDQLIVEIAKAEWRVTSIDTMKRAWDFHDDEDEDDIVERQPSWLELIEVAERDGLSLGQIHTFRIDRRKHPLT